MLESMSYLCNKDGFYCLFWASIHQLTVAASTLFITKGMRYATSSNPQEAIINICVFVISFIVIYFPSTLSLIYLQKWHLQSLALYIQNFKKINYGKTTWAQPRDKAKHESWLTNEGNHIIDSANQLLYELYSILLFSFFNIIIAVALVLRILYCYFLASIVLLFSHSFLKKKLTKHLSNSCTQRKILPNLCSVHGKISLSAIAIILISGSENSQTCLILQLALPLLMT
ncbi:hypothetical protein [Fluviispira sanaruensis]|uniref:hypothetical protein n=1 Tax=Fluviispira sanaruensis TaxID=2493639 RepID=UPI00102E7CC3|nr:hypothetical protein [Fluviispira sanaruensis]